MADAVTHRGPDGEGLMGFDGNGSVADSSETRWTVGLGFRRLSIIDLSQAASQPMVYRQRYWLIYNGEVYNYVELRAELERKGHLFATRSDSEVILASYAEWGIHCFGKFRGMWGLVIFDSERQQLVLSRDRLGIKPLYLWRGNGAIAVASEIKQLLRVPGFEPRRDEETSSEFLRTGYEDPTRSFFKGVVPLGAGTVFQISARTMDSSIPVSYWEPERVPVSVFNVKEASEALETKLSECVRIHLRSDVPVGCALSGGLDSSAIAAFTDRQSNGNGALHTFTVSFPGDKVDERRFVEAVLSRVNAIPHFVTPSPSSFLHDLNDFIWHQDEPVGSMSMYAGYCIARLTRKANVPVTLNGQGGDEVFSGYWQCFFLYLRELARRGQILRLAATVVGSLMPAGNPAFLAQVPVMLRRYRSRRTGGLALLTARQAGSAGSILEDLLDVEGQARRIREIRDMFLPRLLKWDDRSSMAFSVEGRYPFLDHELIELCLSFSPDILYSRGWTKWPLRRVLEGVLPEVITRRRSKRGFEVPQDSWLCGALRPELERWLASDRPIWEQVDRAAVRSLAEETWRLEGRRQEPGQALFRCFVYDRWLEVFGIG